jgi:isoleucyl-tRNA synthetase
MTAVEVATATAGASHHRYRLLPQELRSVEDEVLAKWEEEHLFARTLEVAAGRPKYVFFEGPPTANGRPGIHHVFARTVKDLFCRHRAMRGFYVVRKAGWDTHGLAVEIEVEKKLQITAKAQIEALGVAEFNAQCRSSVWEYRSEWERLSQRIGYWLDYTDPYVTYAPDYVESVWWALATLWKRGLLYPGHKILPYCPRCETPLSSHEVAQGYRDVQDPSIYVALPMKDASRRILVWTTTPWTLVSNVALAVNPELEYVELKRRAGEDRRTLIMAASRVQPVLGDEGVAEWEIVTRFRGEELVGQRYVRPLDWVPYPDGGGDHEVIVGESFVSAEDGSGVVHMSPAFGADDYAAAKRNGLAFLQPVDNRGAFISDVPVVGGRFVKDADGAIVEVLKRSAVLWRAERLTHAYPHCWRCGTPLLYYARSSWFIRTTAFRDEMLARNSRVRWQPPEVGTGRFGEWLSGNIDWAISRDRYWGTPLPVWVCDADSTHVEVIDSYASLATHSGAPLGGDFDPHKPGIDAYTWPCSACAASDKASGGGKVGPTDHKAGPGTMRRVPEVIDAWFDSGSMPFAQWHYPFEHRDRVATQYPADFIAEGVDQTRGWFYSLLAIATGLGDALPNNGPAQAAPYRNAVVNELVLDAVGQKMSKSRGNSVDPWRVIADHGADAVRIFLIATSQVWVPRRFDEQAIRDTSERFLHTLRNTYDGIFATYANFGWAPSPLDPPVAARPLLDQWVLSRLARVERQADDLLEKYEPTLAVRAVMQFFDEDVSRWYVRLSRSRFYETEPTDSRAAFATLHQVLTVTARLLAPFAPFMSDWLHRELEGTSVHLAPYRREKDAGAGDVAAAMDEPLESAMDAIRRLAGLGRSAREEAGIKIRQPLTRLVCVMPRGGERLDRRLVDTLTPLLRSELNVKEIEWQASGDSLVTLTAKANFRTLGKKFGARTPEAAKAVAGFSSDDLRRFERGEVLAVTLDNVSRPLDPEDLIITHTRAGDLVVQESDGYLAAIDPSITPALAREGLARELISAIQRIRKEAGLAVSDRIRVVLAGDTAIQGAATEHRDWIGGEILARDLVTSESPSTLGDDTPAGPVAVGTARASVFDAVRTLELDGHSVRIAITKDMEK